MTRGSNSPTSETISPETKRLKESVKEDQANAPPAIVSPPKSKNDSEDVVLSALKWHKISPPKRTLYYTNKCFTGLCMWIE